MITGRDLEVVPMAAVRELRATSPWAGPAVRPDGRRGRTADALVLARGDLSPRLRRVVDELVAAGHALVVEERPGRPADHAVGHGLRMAGYAGVLNSSTVRAVVAASVDADCATFRLDVERLGLFLAGWVAITAATHAFRHRGGVLQVQAGTPTRALSRAWGPAAPDHDNIDFVAP